MPLLHRHHHRFSPVTSTLVDVIWFTRTVSTRCFSFPFSLYTFARYIFRRLIGGLHTRTLRPKGYPRVVSRTEGTFVGTQSLVREMQVCISCTKGHHPSHKGIHIVVYSPKNLGEVWSWLARYLYIVGDNSVAKTIVDSRYLLDLQLLA